MAKVNIVRWDATDLVPQLLSEADTAMINHIDVTGSSGVLTLGSGSATEIVLGNAGNSVFVSSSLEALADLTASAGAFVDVLLKVTGTIDVPGQQSFLVDGTAISTDQFTAPNIDILFNGSNADALHVHSLTAGDLSSSLITDGDFAHTFTTLSEISGTEVVYLDQGDNVIALADSDSILTSRRIVGIASGTTSEVYVSGNDVPVFTIYGDRFAGFTGLTPAAIYYLDTTPGQITTTPLAQGGRAIVKVGVACSDTELMWQPEFRVRGLA